jgi:hypothetical protein
MREIRTPGSERGALGNWCPYRDSAIVHLFISVIKAPIADPTAIQSIKEFASVLFDIASVILLGSLDAPIGLYLHHAKLAREDNFSISTNLCSKAF